MIVWHMIIKSTIITFTIMIAITIMMLTKDDDCMGYYHWHIIIMMLSKDDDCMAYGWLQRADLDATAVPLKLPTKSSSDDEEGDHRHHHEDEENDDDDSDEKVCCSLCPCDKLESILIRI